MLLGLVVAAPFAFCVYLFAFAYTVGMSPNRIRPAVLATALVAMVLMGIGAGVATRAKVP